MQKEISWANYRRCPNRVTWQDSNAISGSIWSASIETWRHQQIRRCKPDSTRGNKSAKLARALRPGGVLIEEDHLHPREAIESTARALADPNIPAIYEAAFQHGDILIRVDVLARTSPQTFEFIEVKSSTKTKPEHKPDVGIQLWVLEGAGLTIDRAILAHLNNAYQYTGGEYEIDELFTLVDLTAESRASQEKHLCSVYR